MNKPFISVVINADTRTGFEESETEVTEMFSGCRSIDFLIDGVQNKINFFAGFDIETILFVDQHHDIPEHHLKTIRGMVDTLVIRKHSKKFDDRIVFEKFNDLNYIGALQLGRGEYLAHFDQDMVAFALNEGVVEGLLALCDTYDYVSYPSPHSPNAVNDPRYNYTWASTRFFMCKRSVLDFTEIMKCLLDYDYMFSKYPASMKHNWLEHALGLTAKYNGKGVYYPPMNDGEYMIFPWHKYYSGIMRVLNAMTYENVSAYVNKCGGIDYHGVTAIKL